MNKPLFLIVGRSGSGKTTIVEFLEKYKGLKSVQSYTTRPKRSENEYGHIFISDATFDTLENIMGYAEYSGHRYCATKEQLDEADLYVVDPTGVEALLQKYETNRQIYIIYLNTSVPKLIDNMITRGDSSKKIVDRLHDDFEYDWGVYLEQLYDNWRYPICHRNYYSIDGNSRLDDVIDSVLKIIIGA